MIQRNPQQQPRGVCRLVLHLVLALTLVLAMGGVGLFAGSDAAAQEEQATTDVTPEADQAEPPPADEIETDSDLPPAEVDEPEIEQPPADETDVEQAPSDELPADNNETTEDDSSSQGADSENTETDEVDQPATPDDAVHPSTLLYSPAGQPNCVPSPGQPALIAHGGFLDFSCTFDIAFTGKKVAPSDIQLDWSVQAAVDGGWSVQLLRPGVDPMVEANWTQTQDFAQIVEVGDVWDAPSGEIAESLDASSEISFGLRIHRATCSVEAQIVRLDLAVDASLPALATATVEMSGHQPATFQLAPALAPIPKPSAAFTGALDFGDIRVTAAGPIAPLEPVTSVLTVTGLDQACGDYVLKVSSTPFSAPDTTETSIGLALASIDGVALPGGDCTLADSCTIATISAGPDAEPAATFILGILLVLPNQPRAAAFDSSLMAALDTVAPGADQTIGAESDSVKG